ncbi:inactive protein kinase SELMODRAFT_444075-like isoform X2 [Rhododendron vialii]|uniref:inactive protein kinase SELMODRAFT_444075-like isoform X2 n=1 Tax=Rhododendron vialii TaxID=182163 RepID=UPI00265EC12B|nr:inactive protein kinase SELMODRAFT_444075-like isoform X2 [Rhododendron vialii]
MSLRAASNVIVAVKAEKVISKAALAWALSHVVHPGDSVTLLAVISGHKTDGRMRSLWNFPRLTGDCRTGDWEKLPERISHQISQSCSQMKLKLHDQIEIKVVSGTPTGGVAAEAKYHAASWVILDKNLKQEQKHCLEELHCSIVVMKRSQPKILRLNLGPSDELQTPFFSAASSPGSDFREIHRHKMRHSTPVSSPEEPSISYARTTQEYSLSSPDTKESPFIVYERNPLFEGPKMGMKSPSNIRNGFNDQLKGLNADGEMVVTLSTRPKSSTDKSDTSVFWIPQNHSVTEKAPPSRNYRNTLKTKSPTPRTEFDTIVQFNKKAYNFDSTIRQAVSLGRTSSIAPHLCSFCQHKAPVFGKPPQRFDYKLLKEATDGFSDLNFLAEGGFGTVHRGVLRDGQVVAVKQLKSTGSKGDTDFCREVRVLSCAQHRNVVLLIGFCVEGKIRLLVYEYVCNGSLDFHLHGNKGTTIDWHSRQKIAVGTARGLRYLHEDCRVGRVVHRNMQPRNILLTHDYEPLIADFWLARLPTECDISDEQVVGTSRYLAPEYFSDGKITEKVDVYAFGLVLLELITGQRTIDFQCYEGQQMVHGNFHSLTAQPGHMFVKKYQLNDLPTEVQAMSHAAFLCLNPDPESRPPVSKVLRILEAGDGVVPLGLDLNSVGSRSGYMQGLNSNIRLESTNRHSRSLSHS